MEIVVLDGYTMNPGDLSWEGIRRLGAVKLFDRTPAELVAERAAGAEAILTNKVAVRAATLNALDSLRYIGVTATGVDIIDLDAARARGVTVTNVPAYGADSVAQFTIALLLELCHHVGLHSDAVRAGAWSSSKDWSFTLSPQVELAGKVLGVIGLGRIGRRVAEIGRALGMRVLAVNSGRREMVVEEMFEWSPLDGLLRSADVVSLHCPLTLLTRGLLSRERLSLMKPTALLLNTARGALIDDQALADALNQGKIAGAGLDALVDEPPSPSNPLLAAKNCIVTPHMAWSTREARARCMRTTVQNLEAFLNGKPQNVVS